MSKSIADNLSVLRERFPDLYRLLKDYDGNGSPYFLEETKDHELNVGLRANGAEVRMYSKYSPLNEADAWAQATLNDMQETKHILVYGLGLGYHLEALLRLCTGKRIYIYEPDLHVFHCAINNRNLSKALGNKQVVMLGVGNDHSMQIEYQRTVMKRITHSFQTVATPPYKRIFGDKLNAFMVNLEKTAAEFRSVLATVSHFQQEWTKNLILNMEKNITTPSIAGLRTACSGIPAIVVGSGPSLEEAIPYLKNLQGHALIIAAGTSALGLLNNGIEPDLVVSMDPGRYNNIAFKKADVREVPLLYVPTIHHEVLQQELNYVMHAYFHVDFMTQYMMKLTDADPIFHSSSSVSGTALQAAAYMGCSEVILVGQDLSFPNNRYYASGVTHAGEAWEKRRMNQSELWVDNVSGGQNRVDRSMLGLKHGIEEIIRMLTGVQVYNASKIGARIAHTQPIDLAKFTDALAENQAKREEGWFKRMVSDQAMSYPIERRKEIIRHVSSIAKVTEQLHDRFEKLDKHLKSYKQEWNERRATEWLNRFDSLWLPIVEEELFKQIHSFPLQREINYLERYWEQILAEKSQAKKARLLIHSLQPMMTAYKKIEPVLRGNMKVLNQRLLAIE